MENPLISVLLPVYNVEKYLCECLESVVNQTYKNIEIILVDDGSTDSSGAICDEYAQKDSRIKVIHQKNRGLAAVRNISIEEASGEYIAFIDSDDFVATNMIEKMFSAMLRDSSDMVVANIAYVDEKGNPCDPGDSVIPITNSIITGYDYNASLCKQYNATLVVSWNKLYKKELFFEIKFTEGAIHEDEYVIHRIAHKCNKITMLSDTYNFYRQQPESIMNKTYSSRHYKYNFEALSDRIHFLKEQKYDIETIINCEDFFFNNIIYTLRLLDRKNKEHRYIIKKCKQQTNEILRHLLKNKKMSFKEKFTIHLFRINPFVFFYI